MNNSQLQSLIKSGKAGRFRVDDGLYIRLTDKLAATWVLRYSINNKRREMTLGQYGRVSEGKLPLVEARSKAVLLRSEIKQKIDPLAEKHRTASSHFNTVNDIANDWLNNLKIKHTEAPIRVYRNDIAPSIGEISIDRVTSLDILGIVRAINSDNRPTVANDALRYCKNIFTHGIKLGLIKNNPATPLNDEDAGGKENPRTRALSQGELKRVLITLRKHEAIFTRDNYLAVSLLVTLGVRKTELTAAKWTEFDLTEKTWLLPQERSKTKAPIAIPLSGLAIKLLSELKGRSYSQSYLFPSRRASKRREYISDDTINHALAKMFGKKVDSKKKPHDNLMATENIEYFTVHDLRRTFRSLLSSIRVDSYTAERCLNHKIGGTAGVYDQYDYYPQRQEALEKLSHLLNELVY
jgi:integrase